MTIRDAITGRIVGTVDVPGTFFWLMDGQRAQVRCTGFWRPPTRHELMAWDLERVA